MCGLIMMKYEMCEKLVTSVQHHVKQVAATEYVRTNY